MPALQENERLKERIEGQELRAKYIEELVQKDILVKLESDYLNGCSYYFNKQEKQIVEVSGFHKTFPFTPAPPSHSVIEHIHELNKELLASLKA